VSQACYKLSPVVYHHRRTDPRRTGEDEGACRYPEREGVRLRGKGLPVFGGYGKGDQLVKVMVEVPEKLNAEQERLLRDFARSVGLKH
jgi:hypothetical protein